MYVLLIRHNSVSDTMNALGSSEEVFSLVVRRAMNGELVLRMSADDMISKTVEDLRHHIYSVIGADCSDVELMLTVNGRTLKDIDQLEILCENVEPVEVLLIVQEAPQFDIALPRSEQLTILRRLLCSCKIEKQKLSSELLRQMVSTGEHSLFQEIIDIGILPCLVKLARNSDNLQIEHESLSVLSNLSCGMPSHLHAVLNNGALDIFLQKLSSPIQKIRDQAVLGIGNVASDSIFVRDLALEGGAFAAILHELQNLEGLPSQFEQVGMYHTSRKMQAVWSLCNLCKGQPAPCLTQIEPALECMKLLLGEYNNETNIMLLHALSNIAKSEINVVDLLVKKGFCPLVVMELKRGDLPGCYGRIRWRFNVGLLEPALDFLYRLLSGTHAHKQQLLSCNVLEILHGIVDHPKLRIRIAACRAISRFFEGSSDDIELAINQGSIKPLEDMLSFDRANSAKEVALHALCCGALGGTREQMDVITMACIRSMLLMLNNGKEQSTIDVLNVIERVLGNQGPKRRKESLDSAVPTNLDVVSVILEESFDKITELASVQLSELNLPSSLQCQLLQKRERCHACDRKGCWRENPRCLFFRRIRDAHEDAIIGNKVPLSPLVSYKARCILSKLEFIAQ